MVIDQALELIDVAFCLIHDNMIVDWTSSTLNSRVGVKIEVILKRMSDVALNKSAWKSVVVLISSCAITLLGEESDVMTLRANNDCPFNLEKRLANGIQDWG